MPRTPPTLRPPFGERARSGRGSDRLVSRGALVEAGPEHRTRHALRAAGQLSREVVSGLQEGVVVCDAEGRAISWNDSARRILRAGDDDLAHRSPLRRLHRGRDEHGVPRTPGAAEDPVVRALEGGTPVSERLHLAEGGGRDRVVAVHARPLRSDGDGPVRGAVCTLQDVTDAVTHEERVRRERDRAQRYLDVSGTIVVGLDRHGRVELLNRQGSEVLGWPEEELLGRDWFEAALPPDERLEARLAFLRVVSEVEAPGDTLETSVLTRAGEQRTIAWRSAAVRDEHGEIVSVLRSGEDVTARRKAEAQVAYLAYHDALTGLPNRSMLEAQLRRDVARARRRGGALAVLFLDLDDFKLVNDSLGHAAGDEVLRQSAQRLGAAVAGAGGVLARQGGDEFLVLLPEVDPGDPLTEARGVGEAAVASLDAPFTVAGSEFHVGVSVGVAVWPGPTHEGEAADVALLRRADTAMYEAKRAGGGVASTEERADDARRRLSLTARLRRAIDEGQLRLHYQPIVRVADRSVTGVEALVRWEDPDAGMVAPDAFVPVAESTGLIHRMGEWVVEELCAQGARWAARGHHPRLSFNLSPVQLRRPELAAGILAAARRHGVPPAQLRAEVTEGSLASADRGQGSPLDELRAAGLTIALDDFGAGYSSLARLRELPVGELKIDRSFLDGVPGDRRAVALLDASLAIGRALGMTTVVEGVETEEQFVLLGALGCELAQGYLLGRPAPAEALGAELLARLPATPPAAAPAVARPDRGADAAPRGGPAARPALARTGRPPAVLAAVPDPDPTAGPLPPPDPADIAPTPLARPRPAAARPAS